MGSIALFDWTRVEISSNFIKQMPIENRIEIIKTILDSCTTDDVGLSILTMIDSEQIYLEGSWVNILKSHVKLLEYFSTLITSVKECVEDVVQYEGTVDEVASCKDTLIETLPVSDTLELQNCNSLGLLTENCLQLVDHTIEIEDSPFDDDSLSVTKSLSNSTDSLVKCTIDTGSEKESNYSQSSNTESSLPVRSCEQEEKHTTSVDVETHTNQAIKKVEVDDDKDVYVTIALDSLNDDLPPDVLETLGRQASLNLDDITDDIIQYSNLTDNSKLWKVNPRDIFDRHVSDDKALENYGPVAETLSKAEPLDKDDDCSKTTKMEQDVFKTFKFSCDKPKCTFKTNSKSHYLKHANLHKKKSWTHRCATCGFTSTDISALRVHKKKHATLRLKCNLCDYSTIKEKWMKKHEIKNHQMEERMYRCSQCDYITTKDYQLRKHSQEHKSQKSFKCAQCPYTVWSKHFLGRHVKNVHLSVRSHLCQTCGKWFKRSDALKQHSLLHQPDRPSFLCQVCNKLFWTKVYLSKHMDTHVQVPPSLCNVCGASFKTLAILRRHESTIHENPGSFSCSECGRKFNTKFTLKRHLMRHSGQANLKQPSEQTPQVPSTPVESRAVLSAPTLATYRRKVSRTAGKRQGGVTAADNQTPVILGRPTSDGHRTASAEVGEVCPVSQGETATALLYLTRS